MRVVKAAVLLWCMVASLPFLFSCDEATKPQAQVTYDSLTVIRPAAGDACQAGAPVTIEWGYPKDWKYQQVVVQASISNTVYPKWEEVTTDPINYPQAAVQWAVPAGTTGDSCRIKIYDYDKNVIAYSGFFKVTK